jgi:prepilin-type N-terminal cleavage/methylation domain-containing protein
MIRPPRHRGGFTLLELLVTMAIGSVLLLVAATMLGRAGDSYSQGSGSVAAEREARAVLTQMGEDFAKAVWHKDNVFEAGGEGWKRARTGFLSLQPEDAQSEDGRSGDLCAVHYYVKDIQVGDTTVRCLMRGFRESGEVFPALKAGSLTPMFAEEDTDEPVAFGVLSFEATPLKREADTGTLIPWSPTDTSGGDPLLEGPDFLRLRLVVARRELLGKLVTTSDWDSSSLRGDPLKATENRNLETYEVLQRFGNDD